MLPVWVLGVYGFGRLAAFTLFDAGSFPGSDTRYLFPVVLSLTVAAVWLLAQGAALLIKTLQTPEEFSPRRLGRVRVAVGGVMAVLGCLLFAQWAMEKQQPPDVFAQAGSYDGLFENGTVMYGWARLRERPGKPVEVEFYEGGKLLGSARADQDIPEVCQDLPFLSGHAFRFPVPAAIRDGEEHIINARIAGTICTLANTPARVRVHPE
jgi:hypothetical protein